MCCAWALHYSPGIPRLVRPFGNRSRRNCTLVEQSMVLLALGKLGPEALPGSLSVYVDGFLDALLANMVGFTAHLPGHFPDKQCRRLARAGASHKTQKWCCIEPVRQTTGVLPEATPVPISCAQDSEEVCEDAAQDSSWRPKPEQATPLRRALQGLQLLRHRPSPPQLRHICSLLQAHGRALQVPWHQQLCWLPGLLHQLRSLLL